MSRKKGNSNAGLQRAQENQNDEFYTQLVDIEKELRHYLSCFKDKVVFCNCDDPYESNFFKYFAMHFNSLGLKKLIATCYDGSPIQGEQLLLGDILELDKFNCGEGKAESKKAYKVVITEVSDENGDGRIDLSDVEYLIKNKKNVLTLLEGNGDFRSQECIELLKESDIVVTNPPFSLFREYLAQLVKYDKKFLIIGNLNSITSNSIFQLVKDSKLWFGASIHSGDREFRVPDYYPLEASTCCVRDGKKYINVKGVRWFTNLDYKEHHDPMPLYKRYTPEEYPKYDNYDAIHVARTADIPEDYYGHMGVPISYMDKYCPDQFYIIGSSSTLANPVFINGKRRSGRFYLNGNRLYDHIVIQRRTESR